MATTPNRPKSIPSSPAYIRPRSRNLPSLAFTPTPYRKYKRDPEGWRELFIAFDSRPAQGEFLSEWCRQNTPGINYFTFRRRYIAWKDAGEPDAPPALKLTNRSLVPSRCRTPGLGDGRGGQNRVWSREMETLCVETIIKPAIRDGDGLGRDEFIRLATDEFRNSLLMESRPRTRSTGVVVPAPPVGREWLTRIRREHGLPSGTTKCRKQPQLTDKDALIARLFIEQVRSGVHRLGKGMVLAMDETAWLLHPQPHLITKIRGEESQLNTARDPRTSITTILTVSAAGDKLPIFFVAQGKTMECTEKFGVSFPHIARPTESGWTRSEILPDYMTHIIQTHTKGQPCLLIMDCYSAHQKYARTLFDSVSSNVEIAWVPECMTSTLSPLDVVINPVIKSVGCGAFRKINSQRRFDNNPISPIGPEAWTIAVKNCIDSFRKIKRSAVERSFKESIDVKEELCRIAKEEREIRLIEEAKKAAAATAEVDGILEAFMKEIAYTRHAPQHRLF